MPLATDTVQLFAIMSIEDEVFEDVTSLEQLSCNGLTLDDLDPVTERLDIGTIRENKLDLNVFRAINGSGAGGLWPTSPSEHATSSTFRRLLYNVRTFCCSTLRLYDFRRGGMVAMHLAGGINKEDAQELVGHRPGSTVTRRHYYPRASPIDVIGLLTEGVEDRDLVTVQGIGSKGLPVLSSADERQVRRDADVAVCQDLSAQCSTSRGPTLEVGARQQDARSAGVPRRAAPHERAA